MSLNKEAFERDRHLFSYNLWVQYINGKLVKVGCNEDDLITTTDNDDNYVVFTHRPLDINELAYERDMKDFPKGIWVLYIDGKLVGSDYNPSNLTSLIDRDCLLTQHGVERDIPFIG